MDIIKNIVINSKDTPKNDIIIVEIPTYVEIHGRLCNIYQNSFGINATNLSPKGRKISISTIF